MKKYIYALCFAATLSGCDLNELPVDTASNQSVFGSEKGLELYSNSFYKILPSAEDVFLGDNMSDYVARTNVPTFIGANTYSAVDGSGWSWSDLRNINYFIENLHTSPVKPEIKEGYMALARFFRALFYFEKVKRFGDVPWVNKPLEMNDPQLYGGRDARTLVMDSVLADIDFACAYIDKTKDDSRSMITKDVALGYKSRICLHEGTFRKYHTNYGLTASANEWLLLAAEAAQQVMQNKQFSLYNEKGESLSYRELFISKKPVSTEIMLAYVCDAALKVTTAANRRYISPTYGDRPSLTRQFVNTYLNLDGTPFTDNGNYTTTTFQDEVEGRDLRLKQTIRLGDYKRTNNGTPYAAAPDFLITFTGYQPIKWSFDESLPYDNESLNDNAISIMRYAEVLLNYAEAKAELGTLTDQDWSSTIGALRQRAGITNGLASKPTKIDTYLQQNYFPTIADAALLEVRRERAIELALEGFRFDDLMRWKRGELLEAPFNGLYVQALNTPMDLNEDGVYDVRFYSGDKPAAMTGVVDIQVGNDKNYSLSKGTYGELSWNPGVRQWEDKKYLYPIPEKDRLENPALGQNPGW